MAGLLSSTTRAPATFPLLRVSRCNRPPSCTVTGLQPWGGRVRQSVGEGVRGEERAGRLHGVRRGGLRDSSGGFLSRLPDLSASHPPSTLPPLHFLTSSPRSRLPPHRATATSDICGRAACLRIIPSAVITAPPFSAITSPRLSFPLLLFPSACSLPSF